MHLGGLSRQNVGPTDPEAAPTDSLRGAILAQWEELGLMSNPNTGANGVHTSASPFEALIERVNWLDYRADRDSFGKLMLWAGVSRSLFKEWSDDPQVTFSVLPMTKSIFDTLEDMDSDLCFAHCQLIASFASAKRSAQFRGERLLMGLERPSNHSSS